MTDRDARYREGIEAAAKVAARYSENASFKQARFAGEVIARRIRSLPLPSTPDDGKAEAGAIACWRYRNELDEIVSEWIDGVPPKYLRDVQTGERVDITDLKIDVAYTRPSPSPSPSPASDGAIREAIKEACDLLAERKYGNPARSPGHNARLVLERALSAHQADEDSEGKKNEAR